MSMSSREAIILRLMRDRLIGPKYYRIRNLSVPLAEKEIEWLTYIKELYNKGLLTEEEFEALKWTEW